MRFPGDSSRVIDSEAGWETWHEAERTPGGERQALSADLVHGTHVATNTEKMVGGLVRGDVHWVLSSKRGVGVEVNPFVDSVVGGIRAAEEL